MAPGCDGNSIAPRGRRRSGLLIFLEGVPMQAHAFSVNRHNVEPDDGIRCNDLHVIGCEPAKRSALTRIYRGKGASEAIGRTPLYLDENNGVAIAADKVDFPTRKPQIAGNNLVTGSFEELRSARLPLATTCAVTRQACLPSRKQAEPRARGTTRSGGTAKDHAP